MEQQRRRSRPPMLEPVLENYMGPSPVSYDTQSKPRRSASAKVAPAGGESKQKRSTSNPLSSILGKLRDRYIRTMNEMAMGGDFAAVAGCHGCVAGPDYPGSLEYQRSYDDRRRELEALREELAALQRHQNDNSRNDSDNLER